MTHTISHTDAAIDRRLAAAPSNGTLQDRPRLLVVRHPGLTRKLSDRLKSPCDSDPPATPDSDPRTDPSVPCVCSVDSFLAAIAEASISPVYAVVGDVRGMEPHLEATAAALRQFSPDVRLVALNEQSLDAAVRRSAHAAGFTASASEVAPLLKTLDLRDRLLPDADPSPAATQPTAPSTAATPDNTTHALPPAVDAELIETLLLNRSAWPDVVLELLRKNAGLSDLQLAQPGTPPPADAKSQDVAFLGQSFGTLYLPTDATDVQAPTQTQLAQWADWLARWLSLEQRVDQLESLSMRDELTSVWNRRYFNRFLQRIMEMRPHRTPASHRHGLRHR